MDNEPSLYAPVSETDPRFTMCSLDMLEALRLRKEGLTPMKIGRILGKTTQTIRHFLYGE
jgi:hypothetical protein